MSPEINRSDGQKFVAPQASRTDMSKESSAGILPFREVVAPTKLQVGQNFYGQVPYDEAIAAVSGSSEIPADILQDCLTRLFTGRTGVPVLGHDIQLSLLRSPESLFGLLAKRDFDQHSRERVGSALKDIVVKMHMSGLPHWADYVRSQYDRGLYDADGTFHPKFSRPVPEIRMPHSYFSWLEQKFNRDRRLALGTRITSIAEEFSEEGQGSRTDILRRWKIYHIRGMMK